jgi:arylsulfatase A-like enzyme
MEARADSVKPFFMMLSWGAPHFPHNTAPEEYKERIDAEKIVFPPNVPEEILDDKFRAEALGYYAHIAALDKCVGDLLSALERLGIAKDTILVFSSDHGEMMGSHGIPAKTKQMSYAESCRVPFLLRYPGAHGGKGRRIKPPINTPDIAPTLLGLCGLSAPVSMQGEDLSGWIAGTTQPIDRPALYMTVSPFGKNFLDSEFRAIKTARHTYVQSLEGPWLLFDDEKDPHQTRNLVGDPASDTLTRKLRAMLETELKKIGDDFKPRKHYIEKWKYDVTDKGIIPYSNGQRKKQAKSASR